MVKRWIGGCEANHGSACQAGRRWRPARLLDVDALRLVETASNPTEDDLQYAALSYTRGNAWSGLAAVQTSTDNLEERKEGIELADLPRTFRDAVAVCRALGIWYLWIDTLCILNDAEDLKREASMMHKTFGHAQVTIAA
jgi:hypothetical protein